MTTPSRLAIVAALLVAISILPSAADTPVPVRKAVEAKNSMVVCVSPPAADVGVAILKKGGSAVDAAVAVALAMAVTWPEAGNIGGGGFMMVAPPGKEPTCIEYRETAPAAATPDLFATGKVGPFDHKATGVPGTVRLIVNRAGGRTALDRRSLNLTDQPFRLLVKLADTAKRHDGFVELPAIEQAIYRDQIRPAARDTRDIVRLLRDGLASGLDGPEAAAARDLIESKRQPSRYRLALTPEEIDIRP